MSQPEGKTQVGNAGRVPADRAVRARLRCEIAELVAARRLVPPLTMEELRGHARALVVQKSLPVDWTDYLTVLVSNAIWQDTVARIPHDRRVIMLPKCLRCSESCSAQFDGLGLLCEECGSCPIGSLQAESESLGYVVLVAEGTGVVTRLIESGKVDAVIGVSCMSVLERAFPHLAADAVPGVAIPLHQDGCHDTCVDVDWVLEAIRMKSSDSWVTRADLDRLRGTVDTWFRDESLESLLGPSRSLVEGIGHTWLARGGKRWRPFLLGSVWQALKAGERDIPDTVRHLAVAVECFHKASLIHDDIEDDDKQRYGMPTLHEEHGTPIALNAGDWLLGEGYRLIVRCGATAEAIRAMTDVASEGHLTLCLGQGDELAWMRSPRPVTPEDVIGIFRRKTAPAFDVALRLGAIAGGADPAVQDVLHAFSSALGVAYQIRDDLEDLDDKPELLGEGPQLSILPALALETAAEGVRSRILDAWLRPTTGAEHLDCVAFLRETIVRGGAAAKAHQLMEHYRNEAVRSLEPLRDAQLKTLLRRTVGRVLPRT
jgi:geranylgeranyl diphosphate synthase, type II